MNIHTANRETGIFISQVNSIKEAKKLIKQYEEQDKINGTYEPNFYDIVDENHTSIRQYIVNYTDKNGATSPIDIVIAPVNYDEDDYFHDCIGNTNGDYIVMLLEGTIELVEVDG